MKDKLWSRNFVQCCLSYFWMNFAFYLLMPTMPVYLVEELGLSEKDAGLALSAYTVGLLMVRPLSGYLVDCFSRKHLYVFAFTGFTLMFCGYFWAAAMWSIMIVRCIQGGLMGMTSVSGNTITIDVIPSSRRGEGMGFYGLTINLAMSLSPLIAVWIYSHGNFHSVVLAGLLSSAVGLLSVFFIKCKEREKVKRPPFSLDRFILLPAWASALSYILVAVPYGMITSFVLLYGKEYNIPEPGYFFLFMATGVGSSRLISGRLVDKGYIHHVAISSIAGLAVVFTLFATIHNEVVFFLSALLIGIGFGTGVPAFQCLFVNIAKPSMRGTATSTYLTSFDIGVGIGIITAGAIASAHSLAVAFLIGALSCVLSLAVYCLVAKKRYETMRLKIKEVK